MMEKAQTSNPLDSREFKDESSFPKPRAYVDTPKFYRDGRPNKIPLDLDRLNRLSVGEKIQLDRRFEEESQLPMPRPFRKTQNLYRDGRRSLFPVGNVPPRESDGSRRTLEALLPNISRSVIARTPSSGTEIRHSHSASFPGSNVLEPDVSNIPRSKSLNNEQLLPTKPTLFEDLPLNRPTSLKALPLEGLSRTPSPAASSVDHEQHEEQRKKKQPPPPPPLPMRTDLYRKAITREPSMDSLIDTQSIVSEVLEGGIFDAEPGSDDPKLYRPTNTWFDDLQKYTLKLLDDGRRNTVKRRIRIAILDTGIDLRNAAFAKAKADDLIKREDFLKPDGDAFDEHGHGTHCAGLLTMIAPTAEIYVARIIKDDDAPLDVKLVIKAINRSSAGIGEDKMPNWDVDIISMSFGFYGYSGEVERALLRASLEGKVIFAAASNNGVRDGIAFPAILPNVFCIHSATGDGRPSDFNPTIQNGKNLSIIGEHVNSAWPCGPRGDITEERAKCTRRMSGTSVATPIAAGVAALILELAYQGSKADRKPGGIFEPKLLARLQTYNGIHTLLRNMSRHKGGHEIIVPWLVLTAKYDRSETASYIRRTLERGER